MSKWYENSKDAITVSTRVRLARNLGNVPFPGAMNEAQMRETGHKIADVLCNGNSALSKNLRCIEMEHITDAEAAAMVERHIISPAFARNRAGRLLVCSPDEQIDIMIGEEDHIRIQVIMPGINLDGAYDIADKIDTVLSEELPIAYDDELGFLTECPTNLGTGLRASVMMHLPALEQTGEITRLAATVSKIGLTVRGTYGEGSRSDAALYQLSNQVTLGLTEQSALRNIAAIAKQIIEKERDTRTAFDNDSLEDAVCRAYGILANARIMESKEAIGLLSRIKLGIDSGFVKIPPELPIRLLIETQPSMLQTNYGCKTAEERDKKRAEILRNALNGAEE